MTTSLDKPGEPAVTEEPGEPPRTGLRHRVAAAYLEGSTPVLVLLAFVVALVLGAILIVCADEPTRTAMGYFFQEPSDTFSRGWHAISSAYSGMFQGAIVNRNSFYSNGGVAILGPISQTISRATPLIFGGLSVGVAFRAGLFNIGGQGQILAGAGLAGYVGFAVEPAARHSSWRSPACSPARSAEASGPGSPACSRRSPGPTRSSPRSCSTTSRSTC